MSRACADLPCHIRDLFPRENLEFAASITSEEAAVLKSAFSEHDCFERVGEMIAVVRTKSPALADRMNGVLEQNKNRLKGLSPTAVEFCKKVITYVTHVQCSLTLGRDLCPTTADDLHEEFKKLSAEDQKAIQKSNPDVKKFI